MSVDNTQTVEIVVPLREEEATRVERAASECGLATAIHTENAAAVYAVAVLRAVCLTSSAAQADKESPAA